MATVTEPQVPPLHPGDKLTREEFLRRWEAHPEIKNAELIGGVVYMASPVSVEHGDLDADVGAWLSWYKVGTPGIACGHNTTSFLLDETPQPDTNLRILPEYGGASWVQGKYLHGTPELLAEICLSSVSYDLHVKRDCYQAARVPEYLAVLLYEKEVRWHVLTDERYELLPPDPDGLFRSRIFPGLWLDAKALLEGDMAQVLARVQDGLNSSDHEAFVRELGRRKQNQ
jgi:hypothetical protein